MKRIKATKAWILLCSIIVVSSVSAVHASHHDGSHHEAKTPQKKFQKAFIPLGIQLPENVLSSQEVSCISADSNIYEIINKAQRTCRGKDIRCTFYHFLNHGYQNIGTLDLNKELFDNLLIKFDNWLLTAEDIGKHAVLNHKGKEENTSNTVSIKVNDENNEAGIDSSTDSNEANVLHASQGLHLEKFEHNANEFNDRFNTNSHKTHHLNHRNKENVHDNNRENDNYIKLNPEYNNKHKYFEVFLPKNTEKGKPRTIYVEVDQEKNEFVLIDEEIYEKLNSNKTFMIELDELSEIADTAFNDIVKSSIHNQNIQKDDSYGDERVMTSDISTNSAINDDSTIVEEPFPKYSNPSVFNTCNLANQKNIPGNTNIINVSKNIVVPYKYMNQGQFYVESQLENPTNDIPTNHLQSTESNNDETDIYQTSVHEETLNTLEYNNKNSNADLELNSTENSFLENIAIPYQNEIDNLSENYEFSKENNNIAQEDDSVIKIEENHNTCKDIDFDNNHNLLNIQSSNILQQNKPAFQVEKPLQEINPNAYISGLSNTASHPPYFTAGIPDSTVSQFHSIPSQNQPEHTILQNLFPFPTKPLTSYINVPLLENDLSKVLETDSNLQSSFPTYAVSDSPASFSQNILLNSNDGHPSLAPNIRQCTSPILLSSTVQSMVRPIKNQGISCSSSPIKDLQLPCMINPSLLDPALSVKDHILPLPLLNSESPIPILPFTPNETVNTPFPIQEIPSYSQSTKPDPNDIGLIKYSPIDSSEQSFYNKNEIMESKNRNPFLKPLQPIMSLKPIFTTTEANFLPLSLDGTNSCLNGDYSEEINTIRLVPFVTNTPFLPIHPLLLGSSILPNPDVLLNECKNSTGILSAAIPNPTSNKTIEVLPTNLIGEALTLKSDSLIPLDSTHISPYLKIGRSPIIINAIEHENIPIVSQENLQNIETKETESESIILPTSLDIPVHSNLNFKTVSQNIQLIDKLDEFSLDNQNIYTTLEHEIVPLEIVPAFDSETPCDSFLIDTNKLHKNETTEILSTLNSENQFDRFLVGSTLQQKTEPSKVSPVFDSLGQFDNFVIDPTLEREIDSHEMSPVIDIVDHLESSLISPNLHQKVESKEILPVLDSEIQIENYFEGSNLHNKIKSPILGPKNVLESNLYQEMKTLDVSSAVDSENQLDSSLIGPNSLTMTKPLVSNEIQIINEDVQPATLMSIDSSLIDTQIDSEKQIDQSEILQDINPELSLTSLINPDLYETTNFFPSNLIKEELLSVSDYLVICEPTEFLPSELVGEALHLESTPSHLQELSSTLISPFTISKSKLSPSEIKSSDKLFLDKISSENIKSSPYTLLNTPLSLQDDTASELSSIVLNFPEQLCLNSESLDDAQEVPNIPITSFFPPLTFNMQNLQASSKLRPATNLVSNAPDPLISSLLLPFHTVPNTPVEAIVPSSVLTPNTLSLDKNVPIFSKTTHRDSTICISENNPIVFDDIMPLLDENSFQLPMKTSVLPSSQSSVTTTMPTNEKSEIISPSLLESLPIFKTQPVLPIPITNLLVPSPIYTNSLIDFNYPQNIPYMIPRSKNQPCNLQPYSNGLKSNNIPLLSLSRSPLLNLKPKIAKLPSNTFAKTSSLAPSLETNLYDLKQNIPCDNVIESNLQISPLTEEVPSYNCIEEINDEDAKLYKDPLQSFSYYTSTPAELAKPLIDNDFEKQVDFKTNLPRNLASEAAFQTRPYLTPITSLPSLKPCPAQTFLPFQPSIKEPHNIPVVPSSNPLRSPYLLPSSVLPCPLLKPLSPISPALVNPSSQLPFIPKLPLLTNPYKATVVSRDSILPMNDKPQSLSLLSCPYSVLSQGFSKIPVTLTYEYSPIVSPAIGSKELKVSPAAPCVTISSESPISSSKSQPSIMPYFSDNYIKLLPTFNEPKSKIRPSQGSLVTPSPTPYDRYVVPITTPPLETPITSQYMIPLSPTPIPQYVSSILPTQTLQVVPFNATPIHYQSYVPSSIGLTSSSKNTQSYVPSLTGLSSSSENTIILKRPTITESSAFNNIFEPVSKLSYLTPQNSLPSSLSSPVPLSSPVSNIVYYEITPYIAQQPFVNAILPTSLFTTSNTDFKVPTNILSPVNNTPRYSLPSSSIKEFLETVPCFMPSKSMGQTILPQNILKPITYFSNDNTSILSSIPLIQPLERRNSYQTQSVPNVQYTNQVSTQDVALSLSPIYPSSLETLPNRLKDKSNLSAYVIPSVYGTCYSSDSKGNLLIDPKVKPISELPTNPVLLSKLTPSNSIISSDLLRPYNLEPNSSPVTYSAPLSSLPLVKSVLPQKTSQQKIPNLHYVSQLPIYTVPLPFLSASPLMKYHLLNNYQNNAPLLPIYLSKSNMVPFASKLPSISSNKEKFSSDSLSLADSELYLSPIIQYLPTANNMPSTVSKLPITSRYNYVPSQKLTHFSTNVSPSKMPLHLNYHVLEPSPNLALKTNIINADKPIEDSVISTSVVTPLYLDMNTIKETESYQIMPDFKNTFSQLPLVQQRQLHPIFNSNHVPLTKPTHMTSPSSHITTKYQDLKSPPFSIPLLLPEETEFIDSSNFIPISPINSEPLMTDDSSINTLKPILTDGSLQNILQSHPYTTLLNTDDSPLSLLQCPQCPHYSKQIPQSSEVQTSPLQNRLFTKYPPIPPKPSSSPETLLSPLIEKPSPLTQIPLYPTLISKKPQNGLLLPILAKSLLRLQENPIEVLPENEISSTFLNKYRSSNIVTTLQDTITEVPSELVSVKPVNSFFDISKAEYFDNDLNKGEKYETKNTLHIAEAKNAHLDELPDFIESKSLTESSESLNVPNYYKIMQRPQRLSKLDNIGIIPQVITIPTTLPINPHIDVKGQYPGISSDFTTIPSIHFGSAPKLHSTLRPNEYYNKIFNTPEQPLITLLDAKNYFNPLLEIPNHHSTYDNSNIKYSGYKTYQIPTNTNLGIPSQYNPIVSTYSPSIPSDKFSYMHQITNPPHTYRPTESHLPPNKVTTPLQTKLSLDTFQQSPEFNEYNNIPVTVDSINEDNELKTTLVNYLNVKDGIIDNLRDNNEEITIPIGNIAINKKEPCNSDIIETNNPLIDLKVWKSKVKVVQAELKLKVKELKVNNFMPIVNKIDKYDLEEIRQIVKKYIDEKYGNHIEINEPYTIDNKYSVIKDFDYTVADTFNLLWPTYNV